MNFFDRINQDKTSLLNTWFNLTMQMYSNKVSNFFEKNKDFFSNPVGNITFVSLKNTIEGLILQDNIKTIGTFVEPMIRIRAVQGFKPSETLNFIFLLKKIITNYFEKNYKNEYHLDLIKFNKNVDKLSLSAFDIYVSCREYIYELKSNESRNQFFYSLNRAGLISNN